MEENDSIDTLLSQYFSSQKKEILTQRFLQIRALQDAAKHISTESSTLWRVVLETLNAARIDPKDLASLADISDDEAQYIVAEVQPEPFSLSPQSTARILITFKLSIKTLEVLLKNALLAQYAMKTSQRALARSSETLGNRQRARSIQDGINALFIQISNEPKPLRSNAELPLFAEDQIKLSTYLSAVINELKSNEAEYLLS
ncbi:MAG: hypothetical protein ABFC84_03605 [Veillonellales bacterium]